MRTLIVTEGSRWSDVEFLREVLQRLFGCVRDEERVAPLTTGAKAIQLKTPTGRRVRLSGWGSDRELLDHFPEALPAEVVAATDLDRVGVVLDLDTGTFESREQAVRDALSRVGRWPESPEHRDRLRIKDREIVVVVIGMGDGGPDVGVTDSRRILEQVMARILLEGKPAWVPAVRDAVDGLRRHGADPSWKAVAWLLAALEDADKSPENMYHLPAGQYPAACRQVLDSLSIGVRLRSLLD